MVYDPVHEQIVLFGGLEQDSSGVFSPLGDTWVWDGENWNQMLSANAPDPRSQHAMAYDSNNQYLF